MHMDKADVVVIGAGVSGLSSAYYLAKAGKDVVLVEKEFIGSEASGRSGGFVVAASDESNELRSTAAESLKIWPTLDEELGYPTEYMHSGFLKVAFTEEEMETSHKMHKVYERFGLRASLLDSGEVRDMVSGISDRVLGGCFTPDAGHANPQRTVQAFGWAFQDRGGRLYQDTAVTGITLKDDRVFSVETTAGSIRTDSVVSAAGPQTALITQMFGLHLPVAPARVESVATMPLEPRFSAAVIANETYVRQTKRGNLVGGGGPLEWTDVDLTSEPSKPNTPLIRNIARRFAELFPGIEDLRILRSWAGIIEVTPDGEPIVDRLDYPEGLVVVCQSGHGFAPAPATGMAVRDLVIHGESSFDLSAFKIDRFDVLDSSWREHWGWQKGAYTPW